MILDLGFFQFSSGVSFFVYVFGVEFLFSRVCWVQEEYFRFCGFMVCGIRCGQGKEVRFFQKRCFWFFFLRVCLLMQGEKGLIQFRRCGSGQGRGQLGLRIGFVCLVQEITGIFRLVWFLVFRILEQVGGIRGCLWFSSVLNV